jgi:phosphoribosylanthranilate isomerase
MATVKVKICCISSAEEAQLAAAHGAYALGLVGHMPSGPGVIDDALIADIARVVALPTRTFLLTSETKVEAIIAHQRRVRTTTVQIVDALEGRQYDRLRQELPGVELVQVIHVMDEASVREAVEVAEHVDAILLDSGNPNLAVKELGGTGRAHDWHLSKAIREAINTPLFLAGGLNAANVQRAVDTVQPFGVDLCSSVRTAGRLDERKLEAFFKALT